MRFGIIVVLIGLGLTMTPSRARESEDPSDLSIEIQAPLQAQDNSTTPPTVKVLGLTISVVSSGNDGTGHRSRSHGTDDPPVLPPIVAVGQIVNVELTGDTAPLTAHSFSEVGAYDQSVKIKAPLQAVDAAKLTITLLGLSVDVSTAAVEGENDDHPQSVSITVASLAVGQNAEIFLDSTKLPALVATKIEVRNFSNQVSLHIENEHGVEIESETEAIHVEIEQQVFVLDSNGKRVKKTVHIETETHNGALDLSGLSPGRARVIVLRKGKMYRKNIGVASNGKAQLKIKVRG